MAIIVMFGVEEKL